jgi:hypothetical protein
MAKTSMKVKQQRAPEKYPKLLSWSYFLTGIFTLKQLYHETRRFYF